MPEVTQLQFNHEELTRLMIKAQGIREGHWQVTVSFKCAATNVSYDSGPLMPAQIVMVETIGLMRVSEPTPLSVDAAAVEWWQESIEV